MHDVTHVVYAALHEQPSLISGWREEEQIAINDRMLRHLLGPLAGAARGLQHVSLLQGTKAYGAHVRRFDLPAREGRSEARDVPNFYWNQEDYLKECQRAADWAWTIFRPQVIFGQSFGSAMNPIPALGVYAALLRERGEPLYYPGGPSNVLEAVDADLLARAIAWAGEADAARNETFNVTNGDVFQWSGVWPAIADALGMEVGPRRPAVGRLRRRIAAISRLPDGLWRQGRRQDFHRLDRKNPPGGLRRGDGYRGDVPKVVQVVRGAEAAAAGANVDNAGRQLTASIGRCLTPYLVVVGLDAVPRRKDRRRHPHSAGTAISFPAPCCTSGRLPVIARSST